RGTRRHVDGSRARTVKTGARPERREGSANVSPGPRTSTTSPSWSSSIDPSRITKRWWAVAASSFSGVSPAAYRSTGHSARSASSSSRSRPAKGSNCARKCASSAVFKVSTAGSFFLSGRLLVIKASFCQLRQQHQLLAKEARMASHEEELDYAGGGLKQETNWWGAFVIGLAGTILVTGIAPVMVTSLGAASIPVIIAITITGYLLCLLLAELSAMMPERTGGSPSYAYPAYKERWPRAAKHINGITAWAYWLGWFPVAPLNMILASFYLADRFHLNTSSGFTPIHTFISYNTLWISIVGILLFFIPAYLGIRFGTAFATILALLSMIPLTFVAIAWIFHPSVAHWGQLSGFHQLDGSGFFSSLGGHGWLT